MTRLLLLIGIWVSTACALLAAQDLSTVISAADPAVVTIYSGNWEGSGVIINPQGVLLTNQHIIGNATEVKVELATRQTFTGTVSYADERKDLAIITLPVQNMPVIPIGDSKTLKRGQVVATIGSPLGMKHTVTEGIVSGIDVPVNGQTYIQTDTPLNPGNSGGPLIDAGGHLVGIVTLIKQNAAGVGFAIPIHRAVAILERQGIAVTTDFTTQGIALHPIRTGAAIRPHRNVTILSITTVKYGIAAFLVGMLVGITALGIVNRIRRRIHNDGRHGEETIILQDEPSIDIELH